jgi:hypothetical protein
MDTDIDNNNLHFNIVGTRVSISSPFSQQPLFLSLKKYIPDATICDDYSTISFYAKSFVPFENCNAYNSIYYLSNQLFFLIDKFQCCPIAVDLSCIYVIDDFIVLNFDTRLFPILGNLLCVSSIYEKNNDNLFLAPECQLNNRLPAKFDYKCIFWSLGSFIHNSISDDEIDPSVSAFVNRALTYRSLFFH